MSGATLSVLNRRNTESITMRETALRPRDWTEMHSHEEDGSLAGLAGPQGQTRVKVSGSAMLGRVRKPTCSM